MECSLLMFTFIVFVLLFTFHMWCMKMLCTSSHVLYVTYRCYIGSMFLFIVFNIHNACFSAYLYAAVMLFSYLIWWMTMQFPRFRINRTNDRYFVHCVNFLTCFCWNFGFASAFLVSVLIWGMALLCLEVCFFFCFVCNIFIFVVVL